MKIVITGGAGFIGSNFLARYVPRHPEHQFINVDKLTYAANLRSLDSLAGATNYEFIRADLVDAGAVERVFDAHHPQLVIHFAAESHVDRSIVGPKAFIETNVMGTFNVLEACRKAWPQGASEGLLHHVSTDEVYGSLVPTGSFTEESRYDPSSPYSASKAASDHLVRAYHRTYVLPVKITNCSNNYGPRQFPEKLIPLMIVNALAGKPLPVYGAGANVRDWLYVDDHCDAIWAVIERGRLGETYNIGGNGERKNLEVVHALCAVLAAETQRPLADFTRLIQFVADRPGHDHRYAIDASRVAAECGWTPRETFESGLERTVRWYLDNAAWIEDVRTGEYLKWMERNYGARSEPGGARGQGGGHGAA